MGTWMVGSNRKDDPELINIKRSNFIHSLMEFKGWHGEMPKLDNFYVKIG